jgi:hypothetical protein
MKSSRAADKINSLQVSVLLAHGPNYFVLLAALVTIALDVDNIILPIAIMTVGHVMAGIWGGWQLLAGNKEKYKRINFHWADALSLTGAGAALLVMMQLERLVIPKVLELEALATFSLLAAIALAPFRLLQMGVARTLLPRLGNAESIETRRKLVREEALIVCGTLVATSVAVWVVTPFVVRWFLSGRYESPPPPRAGGHCCRASKSTQRLHQCYNDRFGNDSRTCQLDRRELDLGFRHRGRRCYRCPVGPHWSHLRSESWLAGTTRCRLRDNHSASSPVCYCRRNPAIDVQVCYWKATRPSGGHTPG